jgi:hypothetical protein
MCFIGQENFTIKRKRDWSSSQRSGEITTSK